MKKTALAILGATVALTAQAFAATPNQFEQDLLDRVDELPACTPQTVGVVAACVDRPPAGLQPDDGDPVYGDTQTVVFRAASTTVEQRLRRQLARERTLHANQVKALRSQLTTRTSIRSAIAVAAVATGVPASQIRTVAHCESRMQATAVGRTPVGPERAVGLMQWLPSSFSRTPYGRAGLNPFDPYVSALAAAETVRKEGWRQWACKP